jgi:hypothetical protein
MAQKVTSAGVLLSPVELYRFLDAATESVTTDPALGSIRDMAALAARVRGIGLGSIDFTTVPNEPYPPNPNRVQWSQPGADELWERLREDNPLTAPSPSASRTAGPSGSPGDPASAGQGATSPGTSQDLPAPSAGGAGTGSGSPTTSGPASPSSTFGTRSADGAICPPG